MCYKGIFIRPRQFRGAAGRIGGLEHGRICVRPAAYAGLLLSGASGLADRLRVRFGRMAVYAVYADCGILSLVTFLSLQNNLRFHTRIIMQYKEGLANGLCKKICKQICSLI